MSQNSYHIGMIGLGVMGRNLALNMVKHGFSVVGYDKDPEKIKLLLQESEVLGLNILGVGSIKDLVASLKEPRAVMLLVPAGFPVDSVINELVKHLKSGDLIIDGGNSYFKHTNRRECSLSVKGIKLLGVGISGGEIGAREGPSIMPGGPMDAYEHIRPIFEALAAKYNGEPCVTYLGSGSVGHFVKMVHNGIEYALMQLISETYDIMKRGACLDDDELHNVYAEWNKTELNSYLVEITSRIFSKVDEKTGKQLIDEILGVARQKGTGMWTSKSAMELQVPIPTIDVAVAMRNMSVFEKQRSRASGVLHRSARPFKGDKKEVIEDLQRALYTGMIIIYAQGMVLLASASEKYGYNLDLEAVIRVWRDGCIIRSALLEDVRNAFHIKRDLPNLLLDENLSQKIMTNQEHLRRIVCTATQLGVPAPGFMVSLGYLDAYRSAWLPANLIQAQRDYFGSHSYERVDKEGTFHTEWTK